MNLKDWEERTKAAREYLRSCEERSERKLENWIITLLVGALVLNVVITILIAGGL